MNTDEFVEAELDDDGTKLTELLERAEKSLCIMGDNKYYATREEIFLLTSQPDLDRETRIEKDRSGNWVIEIYYSKMTFVHVTPFQAFSGERVN